MNPLQIDELTAAENFQALASFAIFGQGEMKTRAAANLARRAHSPEAFGWLWAALCEMNDADALNACLDLPDGLVVQVHQQEGLVGALRAGAAPARAAAHLLLLASLDPTHTRTTALAAAVITDSEAPSFLLSECSWILSPYLDDPGQLAEQKSGSHSPGLGYAARVLANQRWARGGREEDVINAIIDGIVHRYSRDPEWAHRRAEWISATLWNLLLSLGRAPKPQTERP